MTLSTDPMQETPLTLKERRPFSLLVTCEKSDGRRLDLTGASARLVVADTKRKGGDVKVTSTATIVSAADGTMRFDLQGDDLDFGAGLYDQAITLTTAEGYAATIVEGPLELTRNPDPTVPDDYVTVVPPLSLTVLFRDLNRVTVKVNHSPDSMLLDINETALAAAGTAVKAADDAEAAAAQAGSSVISTNALTQLAQDAAAASQQSASQSAASASAAATSAAQANASSGAVSTSAAQAAASATQAAGSATTAGSQATAAQNFANLATTKANEAAASAAAAQQAASGGASSGDVDAAVQALRDDVPDIVRNIGKDEFVNQQSHADAVHVHGIRVMTQAAYNALAPDTVSDCLYVIRG